MQYQKPKVIFVDVDGTLRTGQFINERTVDWCKSQKTAGFSLVLWSSRGEPYAKQTAAAIGITGLFDHIISKPGYILDDKGWTWTKYTQIARIGEG